MAIRLVPHDPRWGELYETAAAGIRGALGSTALSIHHVGSTAIPDIVAKPVIDMLVLVDRYDPEAAYREPLASLAYAFDHRDDSHVFFTCSRDGVAYQVHVVEKGAEDARAMIAFREYLRAHPDEARRYDEPKKELAEQHSDGTAYADAKSSYVLGVVRLAESSSKRDVAPGT